MANPGPTTSRRALLGALTTAPIAIRPVKAVLSPWQSALADLHEVYDHEPASLQRTKAGRSLSRFRYHNAERFCLKVGAHYARTGKELMYSSGIVAQLALSAHLLDIGFDDQWCARQIGLHVAQSLAYANATGLGHDCPDMARLAMVLSPYWQWNRVRLFGEPEPDDGGFTVAQIAPLLRALLDRVHGVTGHPRPNGWRRGRQEGQS